MKKVNLKTHTMVFKPITYFNISTENSGDVGKFPKFQEWLIKTVPKEIYLIDETHCLVKFGANMCDWIIVYKGYFKIVKRK